MSLPRLIDHLRARPEILRDRASFYSLRSMCETVRKQHGVGAAMGWSAELYMGIGPEMDALAGSQLLARDAGAARILDYADSILCGDYDDDGIAADLGLPALNDIMTGGSYIGHPLWHSENPWFRMWYAAKADTSQVSDFWARNEAATQPRDLAYAQGLLQSFIITPNPGRDELALLILDFIAENGRPPRILDIGCGVGNWLVWIAKYCGVNATDCYGTDGLAVRIVAAKDLGETVGIPRGNWMCVNGAANPWDMTPDIVILAATTGCFDDAALDQFLSDVASSGARFVFETHSIDCTPNWHGRPNSDAFFARVGYGPLRSKMCGDVLTRENLSSLVLPCKYFMSIRAAIYERAIP